MASEVNYTAEDFGGVSATPNAINDLPSSLPIVTVEGVTMFETQTVLPVGIASAEAWGTAVLNSTVTVSPTGIPSAEAWGTPVVLLAQIIAPTGIPSAEAWGTPALTATVTLSPTGIPSEEAWGTPQLDAFSIIYPVGIASEEAFGAVRVTNPGPVRPVTRNTIVVPCRVKSCEAEPDDLSFYNLDTALLYNDEPISILKNCPAGYFCVAGIWPKVFTYPADTFSVVLPPSGQAFAVVLSATDCNGRIITRVAPAGASAATIRSLGLSIIGLLAQAQASCDAIELAGNPNP